MFCERIRVRRIAEYRETADSIEDVRTNKVYASSRVLARLDDAVYLNLRTVQGFTLDAFITEALDRYSYVTDYIGAAVNVVAQNAPVAHAATPFSSEDLDRVLNVCQSMGQWAWGYCVLCDMLGVTGLSAANVVWDGFPHLSRIGVVVNDGLLWLSGAARQVLEYWFTVHGGYYSTHESYVSDRENYERACMGVASPWVVADVERSNLVIANEWLPVAGHSAFTVPDTHDQADGQVLYKPSPSGKLLAYSLTVAPPHATCERTAWLLADRIALVARMAVPMQLREEILHG